MSLGLGRGRGFLQRCNSDSSSVSTPGANTALDAVPSVRTRKLHLSKTKAGIFQTPRPLHADTMKLRRSISTPFPGRLETLFLLC